MELKVQELSKEKVWLQSEHQRLEEENAGLRKLAKGKEYGPEEAEAAVVIQKNFK